LATTGDKSDITATGGDKKTLMPHVPATDRMQKSELFSSYHPSSNYQPIIGSVRDDR